MLVFESDGLPEEAFVHTRFLRCRCCWLLRRRLVLSWRADGKKNMKTVGEEAFAHYVYNGQNQAPLRLYQALGRWRRQGAARLLLTGHVGAVGDATTPKGVTVTASLVEAMVLEDGAAARCP